jgi:hypothetical protein
MPNISKVLFKPQISYKIIVPDVPAYELKKFTKLKNDDAVPIDEGFT